MSVDQVSTRGPPAGAADPEIWGFFFGDSSIEGAVPIITIAGVLVLGALVLAAILLAKKRAHKKLSVMGLFVLGATFVILRPVCAPIPDAELRHFTPPIEERDETNFYGLRTFQRRGEQWFVCKTAVASWFSF